MMIRRTALMSMSFALIAGHAAMAQTMMDTGQAEETIVAACKSEDGADPIKCECYVSQLKSLLPEASYRRSVILAALAMTNEALPMLEFIRSENIDAEAFTALMEGMEAAIGEAEARCGA